MNRECFLETERVCFSLWKADDLPLAVLLWSDPQVARRITASGIFTAEQIRDRLALEIHNGKEYGVQYWPVFEKKTGELIGAAGLRPLGSDFEIGFHLRPQFWHQGFGYEAAEAVIRYAFDSIGAQRLYAGHHPQNGPSRRLIQKLGFKYIGDRYYPPTGLYHPAYMLEKTERSC